MWIMQVKGHWRGRDGGWRPAMGTYEGSAFYTREVAECIMGACARESQCLHEARNLHEAQDLKLDATFRLFQVEELPGMVP